MRILVKERSRTLALVSKTSALVFRHIKTKNNQQRCVIEFVPKADIDLKQFKVLSEKEIHGFLGLIEIEGDYYLSAITGSSQVAAPVPGESINKIYNVDFFNISKNTWDFVDLDPSGFPILPDQDSDTSSTSNGQYNKHPCHELRKLLSTGGFYFSNDFDLTSDLQSRGIGGHSLSFDKYNEEYMWNSFMLQEIVEFRNKLDGPLKEELDDEGFLTTVIRGFAETFQTYLDDSKVHMTVISKQSWKRAGTRFNSRGIDDDSYVANFVETEYILYSSKLCYSYTQIRGSIPVFWEQDTALINPKVQITRSEEATQPVFDTHFKRLLDSYGSVNVVNLLSTKSSEIQLSKRYRYHIEKLVASGVPDIYLTEFNFHKETSDKGYSSSTKIYNLIKESLYEFGYFSYDVKQKQVLSEQRGVFRTNCLDCLDRTNLIQQFISNFASTIFLKDHGYQISQESEFFNKHNTLWADNGDQISQIYTGTNALKSSFSRSGKMSFAGALSDATKSVSRMYINNFVDKGKQITIDTLLGRINGQVPVLLYDPITDFVNEKLSEIKDQYTSSDNINIFAGTYNVNGISQVQDLSGWLYPIGDKFKPNIVVLGFQEVIELTAGSILNADYTKSSFWTNEVSKCLNQFDKYVMLRAEQMSSLLLLFFVRADSMDNVKQVEGGIKKTGLGGITGNKGAVAIRFNYGASNFCFVNVHLAAGTNNVQDRNNDCNSILKGIRFSRGGTINDNESVFWIGDLNYRIALDNEEVRSRVENEDFSYLIQYDQLTNEIKNRGAFAGFSEPSLNFKPTYKYDKGSHRYDSSEKARTPSWTDRIIFKGTNIKALAYSSSDSLVYSDHKPVYGAYRSRVEFIDEEKRLTLGKSLYETYKATHPEDSTISLVDFSDDSSLNTSTPSTQEVPNFLDSHDDYKPQLPVRRDTNSPSYTGVLTPKRNSPTPPEPPARRTTNLSLPPTKGADIVTNSSSSNLAPPPPPAPRSTASSISSNNKDTPSSTSTPPPAPSPRKQLPPGYSDMILKPKSSTPSRTGTPQPPISRPSSTISNPVKEPTPPTDLKKKPPTKPKKPEALTATHTSSSLPPIIPKKPESLSLTPSPSSSFNSAPLVPKKPNVLRNVSTDEIKSNGLNKTRSQESQESKGPLPLPSGKPSNFEQKSLSSWEPLVPK